jgi:hypothetical protein
MSIANPTVIHYVQRSAFRRGRSLAGRLSVQRNPRLVRGDIASCGRRPRHQRLRAAPTARLTKTSSLPRRYGLGIRRLCGQASEGHVRHRGRARLRLSACPGSRLRLKEMDDDQVADPALSKACHCRLSVRAACRVDPSAELQFIVRLGAAPQTRSPANPARTQ